LLYIDLPGKGNLDNWSNWLAEKENDREIALLRKNTAKGLPVGDAKFIEMLEKISGRKLRIGYPWFR